MIDIQPGTVIRVKAREFRSVSFLGNGQRCEFWLPAGDWEVEGECTLTAGRDESAARVPAVIIRRPVPIKDEGKHYVGPGVIAEAKLIR